MPTYRRVNDRVIWRTDTNVFVPVDLSNADYQTFLLWQIGGGVLEVASLDYMRNTDSVFADDPWSKLGGTNL